ncbi:hypothetical protein GCM10008955_12640 [Deinococcus malanensis]|uniref:DUF4259 domain-containing protein n=1 Tax=Deinococcus malanensis TaxID=1706855 RepID=A0ABQ2ER18_9DEIO|nr:DUF4259 domain-containing protein [Deinococcus malanensis]GGK20729.1 hypothetical protein GCM10008955_12640 [Deinococcus malanensis]
MNVWGTGPFENEVGAAFAQEVQQDGPLALAEAFEVALDPDTDFLAAEEGHRVLAAAQILAAVLGGDTASLTDAGLRAWVQDHTAARAVQMAQWRDLAREALDRTLGPDSELPEQWEDSADADTWRAEVQRLRLQLG